MRRSSLRQSAEPLHQALRSPYRCRDCGERFWVTGRRAYYLVAALGVVIIAAVIGLVMPSGWDLRPVERDPAMPVSEQVGSTMKLAEAGDPAAEHRLAQMYAVGDGVPRNANRAAVWLERAARHGDAQAQYELGIALREGRDTVQDDERAFWWMQKAADAGNAPAQFELGRMYLTGIGTRASKVKAYTYLNVAAAHGAVEASLLRDVVRGQLSADELGVAQAEARRLSEVQSGKTAEEP